MRESIKVIKWCGLISFIFLVLTYLVTVNSEVHYIELNTVWISNSFFLTLFGGVFASMLVVVLCEIQKYLNTKTNTEQYLFFQGLYLYQALMQMKIIIEDYNNDNKRVIPENLLDESVRMIQSEISALELTDYATFRQIEKSLMYEHRKFCLESIPRIRPVLQSSTRLKLAINETVVEQLQESLKAKLYINSSGRITSRSVQVAKVLNDELLHISCAIELVDNYIYKIDKFCNNRYVWDKVKEQMNFLHVGKELSQ